MNLEVDFSDLGVKQDETAVYTLTVIERGGTQISRLETEGGVLYRAVVHVEKPVGLAGGKQLSIRASVPICFRADSDTEAFEVLRQRLAAWRQEIGRRIEWAATSRRVRVVRPGELAKLPDQKHLYRNGR